MSKSLGNVIDPMDVIKGASLQQLLSRLVERNLSKDELVQAEADLRAQFPDGIPQCGADALRFSLVAYTTQGRDIQLSLCVSFSCCPRATCGPRFRCMHSSGSEMLRENAYLTRRAGQGSLAMPPSVTRFGMH